MPGRRRRQHPQAPRLLNLLGRRQVHADELAAIEREREDEARPVADEIERLETEEAEAAEAIGRLATTSAELGDQIALIESEWKILCDLQRIAEEALRESADRRGKVIEAAVAARARFEEIITPAHAKHVKRRLRHLDEQIERILGRHPELRVTELDKQVDEEIASQGLPERVQKVSDTFRSKEFKDAFGAAVDEAKGTPRDPRNEEQIRTLAYSVLHGLGVNTRDVHFHVFWAGPEGNKAKGLGPNQLGFSTPSVSAFAVDRIKAAIIARRGDARAEAHAA